MLSPCYVLHSDLVFDIDLWPALGAAYFYYKYRFPRRFPASWDDRELLEESAGIGCEICAFMLQDRLAEVVSFSEESQMRKFRAFDVFAGAGAMSLGMAAATGGMETTHAVEIAPSAARTFRCVRDKVSRRSGGVESSKFNDRVSFAQGATPRAR